MTIAAVHQAILAAHPMEVRVWWPDDEACEVEVCATCSVEYPCPTVQALASAPIATLGWEPGPGPPP